MYKMFLPKQRIVSDVKITKEMFVKYHLCSINTLSTSCYPDAPCMFCWSMHSHPKSAKFVDPLIMEMVQAILNYSDLCGNYITFWSLFGGSTFSLSINIIDHQPKAAHGSARMRKAHSGLSMRQRSLSARQKWCRKRATNGAAKASLGQSSEERGSEPAMVHQWIGLQENLLWKPRIFRWNMRFP